MLLAVKITIGLEGSHLKDEYKHIPNIFLNRKELAERRVFSLAIC
jgi:hypothetical protein